MTTLSMHRLDAGERSSLGALQALASQDPSFARQLRELAREPLQAASRAAGRRTRPTQLRATDATPTLATISAEAFWWGYHFVIPEASMEALSASGDIVSTFLGLLGAIAPELELVLAPVELFLEIEFATAKGIDDGAGVYLSASWVAPALIIPTPIEWELVESGLGNDLVLDVQGFQTDNGTPVDVYTKKDSGTDNQLWTYVNDLYLVSKQSGRVLEIASFDPSDGAKIQIYDWNGGTNQQWTIDGDGFIRSVMNGNVLDVQGGSTEPGTRVISWPPKRDPPADNQSWTTDF